MFKEYRIFCDVFPVPCMLCRCCFCVLGGDWSTLSFTSCLWGFWLFQKKPEHKNREEAGGVLRATLEAGAREGTAALQCTGCVSIIAVRCYCSHIDLVWMKELGGMKTIWNTEWRKQRADSWHFPGNLDGRFLVHSRKVLRSEAKRSVKAWGYAYSTFLLQFVI